LKKYVKDKGRCFARSTEEGRGEVFKMSAKNPTETERVMRRWMWEFNWEVGGERCQNLCKRVRGTNGIGDFWAGKKTVVLQKSDGGFVPLTANPSGLKAVQTCLLETRGMKRAEATGLREKGETRVVSHGWANADKIKTNQSWVHQAGKNIPKTDGKRGTTERPSR